MGTHFPVFNKKYFLWKWPHFTHLFHASFTHLMRKWAQIIMCICKRDTCVTFAYVNRCKQTSSKDICIFFHKNLEVLALSQTHISWTEMLKSTICHLFGCMIKKHYLHLEIILIWIDLWKPLDENVSTPFFFTCDSFVKQ